MIEVLDSYSERWDEYLDEFGIDKLDIYYTKEYCRLYETKQSKAFLFVCSEGKNIGIYPFLKTSIQGYSGFEEYYDIETPYGYGGPLVNNYDKEFNVVFEESFLEFCYKNNIIAEFVRFHPILENKNIFKNNIDIIFDRNTIVIDLSRGIERVWEEDITSKNRNMIRKGEKNNLQIQITEDYQEFLEIYNNTMRKVNASSFYFFNEDYYKSIIKIKGISIFTVMLNEEIIATAIFMKYNKHFHYHLAGSKKEYLKLAPNNFLLWEAIKYAYKNECVDFHLGGGTNNSLENSLYKFKKSFSDTSKNFYIGKRVHNQEVYNKLINEWECKNNKKASLLLQYKVN